MPEIEHPDGNGTIEVEPVSEETHHGRYVQVRAVDPDVSLSDGGGHLPWFEASEVEGL